jgi:hypothetical protein
MFTNPRYSCALKREIVTIIAHQQPLEIARDPRIQKQPSLNTDVSVSPPNTPSPLSHALPFEISAKKYL